MKKDRTLLKDYNNLKDLVGEIINGNFSDDQISLNDFKNSVPYQDADENMKDCINLAAKIGHNLADNEIVHCFKNKNYFKQKYSRGNNSTSNTNIKSANSINNTTSGAANMTGSGANMTGSGASMTGSGNTTGSAADVNATSSKYQ